MFELIMQLHGGGSGGGTQIKQSAPGSTAGPTITAATEQKRHSLAERMSEAKGKNFTNKTQGMAMDNSIKKALLGE